MSEKLNPEALRAAFVAVFGAPKPKWTEYEWTLRAFERGVEAYLTALPPGAGEAEPLGHEWIRSTLGCKYCGITNRETAVLWMLDSPCEKRPSAAYACSEHEKAKSPQHGETEPVAWVPKGWQIVPEEPTEDILDQMVQGTRASLSYQDAAEIWAEALSAAPSPPAPDADADADADAARLITCQNCQGNGEVVTDWDRYLESHEGDIGDEAVAECPECAGHGTVNAEQARRPRASGKDEIMSNEKRWHWFAKRIWGPDGYGWKGASSAIKSDLALLERRVKAGHVDVDGYGLYRLTDAARAEIFGDGDSNAR